MRASGGFRFLTTSGTFGAQLLAGQTSWSALSDQTQKKDIRPADCRLILDKLSNIPISEWHYNWEAASAPLNLGPMAQDFKAAFYPGRDDKRISTLEFDGVALAAIQGLNEKLEGRLRHVASGIQSAEVRTRKLEDKLEQKDAKIAELEQRLAALEGLITSQNKP
jgi:hypothetical protein